MNASVPQSVMWAARFFFVDSAVSWALLGATLVQLCKYLPHRRRDERWQVWSLVAVFFLNSMVVGLNLLRMILSNTLHYGDRFYKNNFGNRVHVPLSWFIGLIVIVLFVLYSSRRPFRYALTPEPFLLPESSCSSFTASSALESDFDLTGCRGRRSLR